MRKRVVANEDEDEDFKALLKADNDRVNDPEAAEVTTAAATTKEPSTIRLLCEGFLIATVVFVLATFSQEWIKVYYPSLLGNSTQAAVVGSTASSSSTRVSTANDPSFVTAPKCTTEQLAAIRKQINPASIDCTESVYQQLCPVTAATKSFNPTWLTNYYSKAVTSADPFLAITVGCNDGMEAVDILRLGTMDPTIDVTAWKTAVGSSGGRDQVTIPSGSAPRRTGKMYCIEEKTDKVEAISKAIGSTLYASKGMNVVNFEFSATNTLENFVQKNLGTDGSRINYLQFETDKVFDIISGGKNAVNRAEYLIYVMDWKGAWSNYGRNTKTVTTLLDKMGFTCYWAGVGKLWRITSCLFREYGEAYKYWSHVACANRNLAPSLVDEMENLFNITISTP